MRIALLKEIRSKYDELAKSKGCAKLEVTEPPRNFVPEERARYVTCGQVQALH